MCTLSSACVRSWMVVLAVTVALPATILGLAARADDAPAAPAVPATPAKPAAAAPSAEKPVGDPYPLGVCLVSGEKLDAKAVVHMHEGRELKFCCPKCVESFKGDPAKTIAELDKKIVAQQTPFYPLTTCVVMPDDELAAGESKDIVYNNRLVRFCCPGCVKKFKANPAKFWAMLDEAVIKAQKPTYKLATCPIGGEKLGAMGEPVDIVINNRLVRLCCKGCEAAARKDPVGTLAKLGG